VREADAPRRSDYGVSCAGKQLGNLIPLQQTPLCRAWVNASSICLSAHLSVQRARDPQGSVRGTISEGRSLQMSFRQAPTDILEAYLTAAAACAL
jgi:hypothetical protein